MRSPTWPASNMAPHCIRGTARYSTTRAIRALPSPSMDARGGCTCSERRPPARRLRSRIPSSMRGETSGGPPSRQRRPSTARVAAARGRRPLTQGSMVGGAKRLVVVVASTMLLHYCVASSRRTRRRATRVERSTRSHRPRALPSCRDGGTRSTAAPTLCSTGRRAANRWPSLPHTRRFRRSIRCSRRAAAGFATTTCCDTRPCDCVCTR